MTTPDPAAPVAGTDAETQIRLLCHPSAEVLDEKDRIDRFVRWGSEAAAEIARLRAEVERYQAMVMRAAHAIETIGEREAALARVIPTPDPRDARIAELEAALREVMETLTVPAAEYVPAIPDAWGVIRRALGDAHG